MLKFNFFLFTSFFSLSLITQGFTSELADGEVVSYHLGSTTIPHPFQLTGFSAPEETHIWTLGKHSTITLPLSNGPQIKKLTFKDTGALLVGSTPQILELVFNGVETTYTYNFSNLTHTIDVLIPANIREKVELTLHTPNACLPGNGDTRELAILFTTVNITYAKSLTARDLSSQELMDAVSRKIVHEATNFTESVADQTPEVLEKLKREVQNFVDSTADKIREEGPKLEEKAGSETEKFIKSASGKMEKEGKRAEKKLKQWSNK